MDSVASLTDPSADLVLRARRAIVLDELRTLDVAVSVRDVAERVGLHVNTARFHLDGLVDDGLASRRSEPRATPGRPRVLYTATLDQAGPRSFGLLAEMLTGLVVSLDGAGPAAVDAGRRWGSQLVQRPSSPRRLGAPEALDRLLEVLVDVGFEPELDGGGQPTEVRLRHCPFREVAQSHADVVCALHLGLMQGALSELQAPVDVTSLEPFVTPSLCIGRLRATAEEEMSQP
jgi:predicted ArsR family transcriptional regulator